MYNELGRDYYYKEEESQESHKEQCKYSTMKKRRCYFKKRRCFAKEVLFKELGHLDLRQGIYWRDRSFFKDGVALDLNGSFLLSVGLLEHTHDFGQIFTEPCFI